MTPPGKQSRIDFSDVIRVYASVSVVMLHVLFSDDWKYEGTAIWWFADILHAIVKPAVPLFVMVSGAFLLDPGKEFSIGKFWLRRASRLLLPFFAWTLVYAAWISLHDHAWPLSELPARFINAQVSDHLWFVYMLAGLYLALPVLRRFVASATQGEMVYFIVLWFVVVCVVPIFAESMGGTAGYLVVTTGFTGYFVGGYWLRKRNLTPGSRKYLIAAIAICALGNAVLAHIIASRTYEYVDDDDSILNDLGPTVAILSFLVFLYFRTLHFDRGLFAPGWIASAAGILSSASYGIYLGHPFVFRVLGSGWVFGLHLTIHTGPLWFGILMVAFTGVTATLALLLLLSKVPLLRILAPMTAPRKPASE